MDPNENLKEQLKLAGKMADDESPLPMATDGMRLAELVLALDQWIRGGGFLPEEWMQGGRRPWKDQ